MIDRGYQRLESFTAERARVGGILLLLAWTFQLVLSEELRCLCLRVALNACAAVTARRFRYEDFSRRLVLFAQTFLVNGCGKTVEA